MTTSPPPAQLPPLPPSCSDARITWVGVVCMLLCVLALRQFPDLALSHKVLLVLALYGLPIAALEYLLLKPHKRATTGLDFSRPHRIHWPRVITKLWGLYATFGLMALAYALLPEYGGGFYSAYWHFIRDLAPFFIPASLAYFIWLDGYMLHPEDGYYQLGRLLLGKTEGLNRAKLHQHLLGWGVKYFFLPLMFIYALNFINNSAQWYNPLDMLKDQKGFSLATELFYGVDVVIVTLGYFCTLRILDTHIRSTEPTLAGWFWALLCYDPIWSFVAAAYINYNTDAVEWYHWLNGNLALLTLWGVAILLLTLVYMLASVGFGLRFSNLTHRGIITHGVYAWCKHPAYVSKNLSWWLIAVPFVFHDKATPWQMFHDCLMLLALNGIYFLRARTEERHLSSDPTYVAYALAMNQRSLFAPLARALPFLEYRPSPALVDLKEFGIKN
jgi:isoprenylcysteine carboxyl methyltransferase (ICMT) family protein YpbQ